MLAFLLLYPNDHQTARNFGGWTQNEMSTDTDFHKKILFGDEARFWLNESIKKQNCRI